MADTAFQTQYRQETIKTFEQRQSLVRSTVTTEAVIKGNEAVFNVVGSGNETAVTRGNNGYIPYKSGSQDPKTATLKEWFAPFEKTGFNIFASQGDQRKMLIDNSIAVINRKIDEDIIATLETGTQNTGAAATASLAMVMDSLTELGNNEVEMDGNINALITPKFHGYLMQTKEFASVDYVNNKPFASSLTMYRWAGVNFIVHPRLTGRGTSTEKCIMYHKSAIGHAMNSAGMTVATGYDEKQDLSWSLAKGYMGAALLQSTGVIIMNHNGS